MWHRRYFLLLLLLGGLGLPGRAQRTQQQLDSLQAAYPFLRTRANHLENAPIGLQRFYQRLAPLALPPGERVVVVHLGDSHLQADDYSGRVRRELQRTYGNAGRGLVFPYEVARTNGSPTYRTAALAGTWRARRATQLPDPARPVGVSGLVLATADSGAAFALRIPALRRPAYAFNQLTVLRQPGPGAFDWQVRAPGGRLLGTVPGAGPGVAEVLGLDSLRNEVRLQTTRAQPGQIGAALYGLVLENGRPGVLYHGVGVNGAQVRQYNRPPQFWAQLPLLHPDLFIISLGTNDVYDAHYSLPRFAGQLDTLVRGLHQACPLAEVLLVAPADSYRARRYRNPEFGRLGAVLRAYAQAHDLAYWDFAAVQGGYGSMRQWRAAGLAQADFIHFTTKGYDLQGLLLYLALQDGFAAFRSKHD